MLQMHAQLMDFQVTDVANVFVNMQACFCLEFVVLKPFKASFFKLVVNLQGLI